MGLARKQRDRLATANQADRCFGACPTFTTDQASAVRERRGQAPCRHRGSLFQAFAGTEPVPFLARVFSSRRYVVCNEGDKPALPYRFGGVASRTTAPCSSLRTSRANLSTKSSSFVLRDE